MTRRNNIKIFGCGADHLLCPINSARHGDRCAITIVESSELRVTGGLYQIVSLGQ
jgi:hypothetical protein